MCFMSNIGLPDLNWGQTVKSVDHYYFRKKYAWQLQQKYITRDDTVADSLIL